MEYEQLFEILRSEKKSVSLTVVPNDLYEQSKQIGHDSSEKVVKMIYDLRTRKVLELSLMKARLPNSLVNSSNMIMSESSLFHKLYETLSTDKNDFTKAAAN